VAPPQSEWWTSRAVSSSRHGTEQGYKRRVSLSQITEQLLYNKRRGSFDMCLVDINTTERNTKLVRSQRHRSAHEDIIEEHLETSSDF